MKPDMNQQLFDAIMAHPRKFTRDEGGTITIFAMFMVLMMVMIGGMGADMMRHEMERTRLQAVADRAVLAAADLDQTLDPEAVVRDYFDKSGMADYVSNVVVDEGLNYRTVSVDAAMTMNTQFMDTMGVEQLNIPAYSKAQEKVNKVEISLVLDISGSMKNNSKMENLQDAASVFIDTVLTPGNRDLISISMIPYSEHVNAGQNIMNLLNVNQVHNFSHCIEMPDTEYSHASLDRGRTYEQMQHYQWNYYSNQSGSTRNTRYDTVCPRNWYEEIVPFSQDANDLKDRIDRFKPRAGTSIFLGMKWAVSMLDNSFTTMTSQLSDQGHVDGVFSNRPATYGDHETLKTIILMTDGQNDQSYRISDRYYNSNSEYAHWNRYNLQYYLYNSVSSSRRSRYYWRRYSASLGDSLLDNICDAAKVHKMVIWSIGFEVSDHGASVMQNCASSPSHFFRVEGVEISEAFSAIARQINQLRLTQ